MSIKSHAFGRVVLTDADAKKFKAQVRYGRPKEAAKQNVAAGIRMSDELQANGAISFRLRELA